MATTVSSAYDTGKINQLVSLAISAENKRVASLETEKSRLGRMQTIASGLKTSLNSMRTAVGALLADGALEAKKTVSSDTAIFDAASAEAALSSAGIYSLNITSLAASHKLGSSSLTDSGSAVLSAEGAGAKTFRIACGALSEDINVTLVDGDSDNTVLAKIMDAVNASSAYAKASLVKESSGCTTLVLEAKSSGTAGALTLSDVSGTLLKSAGALTALGAHARTLLAAKDAVFTIDGTMTITRSSNEISDAITGVTLNLKKEGAAVLTVSSDADAVAAKFTAFVNAYNSVQTSLGTYLTEAASEKDETKGVFYGNRQLRSLRNGLRMRLAESRDLVYASLAQVGLKAVDVKSSTAAQSYNLSLDPAALKKTLQASPSAVESLAAGTEGIFTLLKADLDAHLGSSSGTFAWLEASAASRVEANGRRLSLAQKDVTKKTAYYTALYNSLAGRINSMQTQSNTANSIYSSVYGTTATTS